MGTRSASRGSTVISPETLNSPQGSAQADADYGIVDDFAVFAIDQANAGEGCRLIAVGLADHVANLIILDAEILRRAFCTHDDAAQADICDEVILDHRRIDNRAHGYAMAADAGDAIGDDMALIDAGLIQARRDQDAVVGAARAQ